MTVEEYLHPSDVRKLHVLTRIIDRKLPETELYDVPFMPIRAFNGRKVKLAIKEVAGAGLAAFKADNANTPLISGQGDLQEQYIELLTIAEKAVLNAADLVNLGSPDNAVSAMAARTVVDLGVTLRRRNINRTRWMAWQAAKDALTITYPGGATISVSNDFAGAAQNSFFSGSHLPVVPQAWNHQDTDGRYDTDVITDVYNWTKLIGDDLGVAPSECILHLNGETWRVLRRNKWLIQEVGVSSGSDVDRRRPLQLTEAADVLDVQGIEIVNGYYLEDDGARSKHYFLDDGQVLLTAPYTVNGMPIAEMYDGLVARVQGNQIVVANNPGMLAEIYVSAEQVAENMRVQTARMPVINYPAAFAYAIVWS
ncbi:MAG TPA: major capsid protein [Anaerolineae bacterium]|nr:major capsid protein [Anaerolineae bacterium]